MHQPDGDAGGPVDNRVPHPALNHGDVHIHLLFAADGDIPQELLIPILLGHGQQEGGGPVPDTVQLPRITQHQVDRHGQPLEDSLAVGNRGAGQLLAHAALLNHVGHDGSGGGIVGGIHIPEFGIQHQLTGCHAAHGIDVVNGALHRIGDGQRPRLLSPGTQGT